METRSRASRTLNSGRETSKRGEKKKMNVPLVSAQAAALHRDIASWLETE